ncbi:MAG: tetratricopeptide repeat protein [Planctomycetota bacterium]|jgi:tetratricopeptide (TPR) repeat protein
MRRRRLAPALVVLLLPACQSAEPAAPVATPETEAKPIATYKQQQAEASFAAAIAGLSFDGGLVRVDAPPIAPDPDRARALIAEGDAALQGNRRTSAIAAYAGAVQAAPDEIDSYLRLAQAFVMKGRLEHAIATYATVVELDGANIAAHVGRANALARTGRRAEAIDAMEGVLALDPDNGLAHERLAVWNYYAGDLERARAHVRAAEAAGQPVPPQFIELLNE